MIYTTKLVVSPRYEEFEKRLNAALDDFQQRQGFICEVQYGGRGASSMYNALIIAKVSP